jgi:hypothetical protein
MPLWLLEFYRFLTGVAPVRFGYIHAASYEEAADRAQALMDEDEERVDVTRIVLKPGLRLPRGTLLD